MTLSFRRSRQPAFDGDDALCPRCRKYICECGDAATETIPRVPDWDATTITFGGASGTGIGPDAPPATPPPPAPQRLSTPADPAPLAAWLTTGWARVFTIGCDFPAAPAAATIPCDQAYTNDRAGTYPTLYRSAWAAGWRMDKLRRWACPRHAQDSGLYQSLFPVNHWHPDAAALDAAGEHEEAFGLRVVAEVAVLHRATAAARRGRHQAGAS